ncbi:MAG: DsbA family protein [Hyphomicrobiaceae bacterium]
MTTSRLSHLFASLTTRQGAVIAAPLVLGLAGVLTLFSGPAPATEPRPLVRLAQAAAPAAPATPATPSTFSPAQRAEIEGIIKSYLIAHPEVMIEISKELEKRQTSLQAESVKKVILERKASIFKAPTDFVLGNLKGEISVVEFFDYNCGWCKKAVDEVNKLTKADPQVRVVMKELPIFGENSTIAAKAAMASLRQGKYWDFHIALMKEKQVTKDNVFKIAEKVGINVEKLKADMADPVIEAALKENASLAQELGIEGTPGFVIDSRVNVGFVPADGIKEILADVRKQGCQAC